MMYMRSHGILAILCMAHTCTHTHTCFCTSLGWFKQHTHTHTLQVFLGIMTRNGRYSHKRLTCILQLMLMVGLVWVMFSFSASVFRVPSLHLLDSNTQIQWIPSYHPHTKRQGVHYKPYDNYTYIVHACTCNM